MRRRDLLITGLAAGVAGPAFAEDSPLRVAAREAFLYALPLTEVANVRARLLGAGLPAGRLFPQRALATPEARNVTTPNNDTIYATTFIDLSRGPAKLRLPPLGDRYASLAIMDMFSDNIAVLGTRTTGSEGGVFTLVGPSQEALPSAIRSPTPWVWVLARVVVNGPDDLAAAAAVLSGFGVEPAAGSSAWAPGANRNGPWAAWFKAANALMLENPAPATDAAILRRMAPLGLATTGFDPGRFSATEVLEIAAGVDDARQTIRVEGFGG